MADEDWERLADAYRDHVLAPPVVDADPEVARRRETARMAVGSLYTGGRRPSLAFLLIMERWVNKTMTFEQVLAEIKELDKLETPLPVGTVRISVCGRRVEHQAAMALVKRSPKMTAN